MASVFEKELNCLICLNYLTDPVTICCGHNFCRACLCLSWEKAESPARCPICRETSEQTEFKTNVLIKNLVSLARQASLRQFLSSEEQMCEAHKETKKMFCEENKSLLCFLCSSSEEHEAHNHCSTECAVEEYREKLLKQMRSLWENIKKNKRNLNEERLTINLWMYYVFLLSEITSSEYQKVHPVLLEEEKQHLEGLKSEGKKIFHQLKKSEATMVRKGKHLSKMYEELMNMCHKSDVELLQDLGDILMRSESLQLRMPQPVNPVLSSRPITGLIDRLNQFRVKISFSYEIRGQDIMLFDDVRSLRLRHELQEAPFPSGRYNHFAAWGTQAFISGKHYWEINVDSTLDWAVGVCRDTCLRKNTSLLECENIFLLLCVKEENRYNLLTTSPLIPQYIEKPLRQVGVYVDFDSSSVSFVNVAKSSLIWKYVSFSFNCPLRPFFCTGHP